MLLNVMRAYEDSCKMLSQKAGDIFSPRRAFLAPACHLVLVPLYNGLRKGARLVLVDANHSRDLSLPWL